MWPLKINKSELSILHLGSTVNRYFQIWLKHSFCQRITKYSRWNAFANLEVQCKVKQDTFISKN